MSISDPANREANNWNIGFCKVLMQGDIINLQASEKELFQAQLLAKIKCEQSACKLCQSTSKAELLYLHTSSISK